MAPGVAPLAQAASESKRVSAIQGLEGRAGSVTVLVMIRNTALSSLAGSALLLLAGCGARQVEAVQERSELDDRLSCAHIQGELAANTARGPELAAEAERRGRDSVGMILLMGVAGAAFIDGGESQRQETAALDRRNARLRELAQARKCPE